MLELKPMTFNSACQYIKGQCIEGQVWQIFMVPEVLHKIYVTCVAIGICQICLHSPAGAACPWTRVYISGKPLLPM